MKNVLYLIGFFLGLVLLTHPLLAQRQSMDPCVQGAKDEYVEFVNDNVYALWVFHQALEQLNRDMNAYYEASEDARRTMRLRFKAINVLGDPVYYRGILPATRFQTLKSQQACVPQPYRDALAGYLRQLNEIVTEINSISGSLAGYTQSKAYMKEPDMATGYKYLSRCFVLYHDFSAIKDAMNYELKKLYRFYELPDRKNPYMQVSHSLNGVITPLKGVLKALKEESHLHVKNQHKLLVKAIERSEQAKNIYLEGLEGNERSELNGIYIYVLAVASDIRGYANEYLQSDIIPADYKKQGKSYYYYNVRLTPVFNRYGEGLAARFNQIIEKANVPLLKVMEEPSWFRVVLPDNWEEASLDAVATVDTAVTPTPVPTPAKPVAAAPASLEGAAPNNLIFLLDVSSSMESPGKLPLLKDSFKYLLSLMRPQDKVAIVTYSGTAKIALPSTSSQEKNRIVEAIDNLTSSGKTDALKGVILAYRVAQQQFIEGGNNRIILASDGYFKIPEALPRLVEEKAKADKNIQLSVFYFGKLEEKITKRLLRLAALGDGNYRHIRQGNANQVLLLEAKPQ